MSDIAISKLPGTIHLDLCAYIATKWRTVGMACGLKNYQLENIDHEHNKIQEKARAVLGQLSAQKGSTFSVASLTTTLRHPVVCLVNVAEWLEEQAANPDIYLAMKENADWTEAVHDEQIWTQLYKELGTIHGIFGGLLFLNEKPNIEEFWWKVEDAKHPRDKIKALFTHCTEADLLEELGKSFKSIVTLAETVERFQNKYKELAEKLF